MFVQDSISFIYYGLKIFFFFSLVAALLKTEPLRQQLFALTILYTAAVAFLSYVFLIAPQIATAVAGWTNWRDWQIWLAVTFVKTWIYFKCLIWFEDSSLFWVVLCLGLVVALT